ncbi:MAG: FCD domain-containing protein [Alphaproteobacteria bacterium]|nr:FCD domain-containing protein [Alphaproteobacteria bacterium]
MARTTSSEARVAPATGEAQAPSGATLAETISNRIRASVLSGARPPRNRIRLEDLKAEFQVSWSPLREAMSRLVAEGLILVDEGRAYSVAPVSRDELAEVIRLRCVLEGMALKAAIERGDDAWEAGVLSAHHRLSKLEARGERKNDLGQWEAWHRVYHDALIGACGSPLLLQLCAQLHDLNARYRRLFLSANPFDRNVPAEHRALTAAVMARKPERACALLEQHIGRTGRNILASMAAPRRKA